MRRKVFFLSWLSKYCQIKISRVNCLDLKKYPKQRMLTKLGKKKFTMVSFSIDSKLAKDRL